VVLAPPGTEADAKAYLEPGGAFSPRARSFGIALWVRDSSGRLRTTSDAIPLAQLGQRFDPGATVPPAVVVESPWYAARWTYDGRWRLRVRPERGARIELVVRSVGPAGGPVEPLGRFGARIGLAFQILDDVLDVQGPAERTGKHRGTDLLDGTVTLPLILARERGLEPRRAESAADAEALCDEIAATGALEAAREQALAMVRAAKLELGGLPDSQQAALELVADGVVDRYA